jgi:hypothetical protein
MKACFGKMLLLMVLASIPLSSVFCADDAQEDINFQYQTVTTKDGLTFRVPEDMPIEKRGGIQAPIPFDEYMYGKFKKMDTRLQRMETQLQKIQELLEESIEGRAKPKPLTSTS